MTTLPAIAPPSPLRWRSATCLLAASLCAVVALADPANDPAHEAAHEGAIEREWCAGISPVSWGFAVTPPEPCHAVRFNLLSAHVQLLSATGGPSLPPGWSVELEGPTSVVARGPEPLAAGTRLSSFLVLETNRSNARTSTNGVDPVTWEASFDNRVNPSAPTPTVRLTFPPVLELADAVSRGLVTATIEPYSAWGPAEVTVDNPTRGEVWLDLPPGTVVRVGTEDWVVGLVRPFRMLPKQKTGRTLDVFPLVPPLGDVAAPVRGKLSVRTGESSVASVVRIALAARHVRDLAAVGQRRPGPFESFQPFDFWSLALRWTVWDQTASPPPELLRDLVGRITERRARAGDSYAQDIDPDQAAAEIESLVPEVLAAADALADQPLDLSSQASLARFGR